jgi:hypothetical protein
VEWYYSTRYGLIERVLRKFWMWAHARAHANGEQMDFIGSSMWSGSSLIDDMWFILERIWFD